MQQPMMQPGQPMMQQPMMQPGQPMMQPPQGNVYLISANFPNCVVRHRDREYYLDEAEMHDRDFIADSAHKIIPSGDGVRFKCSHPALAHDPWFLRHRELECFADELDPVDQEGLADSTFRMCPALNGNGGFYSFQAINIPQLYLRHEDFRLKVSERGDGPVDDFCFQFVQSPLPG